MTRNASVRCIRGYERQGVLTRFTASSHAFLSSVRLAVLTFTTSLSSGAIMTLKGPVGRSSDSGEDRPEGTIDGEPGVPLAVFLVRAMIGYIFFLVCRNARNMREIEDCLWVDRTHEVEKQVTFRRNRWQATCSNVGRYFLSGTYRASFQNQFKLDNSRSSSTVMSSSERRLFQLGASICSSSPIWPSSEQACSLVENFGNHGHRLLYKVNI